MRALSGLLREHDQFFRSTWIAPRAAISAPGLPIGREFFGERKRRSFPHHVTAFADEQAAFKPFFGHQPQPNRAFRLKTGSSQRECERICGKQDKMSWRI